MAKRIHDSDSEDGEEQVSPEQSPNQKRSRVSEAGPSNTARDTYYGADGEALADEPMIGDDDDEPSEEEDEEEVKQRTENVERMRRNTKANGLIAESGVIDRVDLHNFMCHKFTTVKFGPQINFLVGHNGSGKSAVLTGITMALGGNARSTNRATKGSGLVATGSPYAVCSVRLKNKGPNAYQHFKYGDYITIERRINADVSGGYKIKDEKEKTLDSKKATLDAILDHFNIQVDNPMTVLTQDQSRQFLASSSARDKYNFFLKGTQLAQLTEEYEIIRANTEQMQTTLETKKAVLPDLKEAYRVAKIRAKEAEGAIGQKESIEKLKHELAWSYVDEIQENIDISNKTVDREARLIPKIEEHLATFRAAIDEAKNEEDNLQEALAECAVSTENDARITELKQKIKANVDKMKALNNSSRAMNQTILGIQATIINYDQKIADEQTKLARDVQAERAPILARIEELNNECAKLALAAGKARTDIEDLEEANGPYREDFAEIKRTLDRAFADREQTLGRINNLKRANKDSYANYHDSMSKLVEAISDTNWNERPLGPIGMFVKLKDNRWSQVLESFFAETLNAFVVTNQQDFDKLTQLKRRVRCNIPVIKRGHEARHNISHMEPDQKILTIYRAIDISDELILAILLTDKHIEQAALVPQRADGDALMRTNPYNVETCFSGDRYRLGGMKGGSSSVAMDYWKGGSRLTSDNSARILELQNEIAQIDRAIEQSNRRKQDIDNKLGAATREKQRLSGITRNNNSAISRNNTLLANLTSQLREEEPSDLASIEANKAEAQAELDSASAQFANLKAEISVASQKTAPWVSEREELEKSASVNSKLASKLGEKLQTVHAARATQVNNAEQYEKRLKKQQDLVASYQAQVEPMFPELEKRTEQASSICERPKVTKKKESAKLQKEIEILQKALRDREKRQGATLEQLLETLDVRKLAAKTANDQIRELNTLVNALVSAYEKRIDRWNSFRETISGRAKMQFAFHLSNRGFTGKLQFDHTRLRLNLRVTTEVIAGATQKNSSKDAKSLSGGEKSFSTICLLLTMWEAVGCPIRCLDEFDVFMDAVNRRISMKMMIDTAKAANATQFILITPSSMGESAWGPEVKVNRMVDPGRGQGTLRMGAA